MGRASSLCVLWGKRMRNPKIGEPELRTTRPARSQEVFEKRAKRCLQSRCAGTLMRRNAPFRFATSVAKSIYSSRRPLLPDGRKFLLSSRLLHTQRPRSAQCIIGDVHVTNHRQHKRVMNSDAVRDCSLRYRNNRPADNGHN
jgi:hypothetical protein